MSRPLSRWQALLLGLVVLAGLALGTLGLFAIGSRGWFGSNALRIQAAFPEIKGVEVGTRIRIHGIDAGEVVGIERQDDDDNPVLLRLLIKGEFRKDVREGCTVRILSEGMLGTKVLEVRRPPRVKGQPALDFPLVADGTTLASEPSADIGDVLAQVNDALKGVKGGEGTVSKLLHDPRLYEALVGFAEHGKDAAQRSKDTMTSLQRDADALKKLPIVGKYIEDPTAILVRANHEKNRRVFSETELFEKGRAVLTASGRSRMDEIAPWLEGLKHRGSEVVVVSYADPKSADAPAALTVTRQQSEAVADYLKNKHKTHKTGWIPWWSTRRVIALGQGTAKPPEPEKEPLPPARVEVIVFVPQS
jgi:phospholipid/cholesterol/gamma-HCH transport system substrate-binding protein